MPVNNITVLPRWQCGRCVRLLVRGPQWLDCCAFQRVVHFRKYSPVLLASSLVSLSVLPVPLVAFLLSGFR